MPVAVANINSNIILHQHLLALSSATSAASKNICKYLRLLARENFRTRT